MNIIIWLICMWYTFQIGLKGIPQPKESYAWEEIETSHGITLGKDYIPDLNTNPFSVENVIRTMAYGDGLTVKKMQYHEH